MSHKGVQDAEKGLGFLSLYCLSSFRPACRTKITAPDSGEYHHRSGGIKAPWEREYNIRFQQINDDAFLTCATLLVYDLLTNNKNIFIFIDVSISLILLCCLSPATFPFYKPGLN